MRENDKIPESLKRKAETITEVLLPSKSKGIYNDEFRQFEDWLEKKNVLPSDVSDYIYVYMFYIFYIVVKIAFVRKAEKISSRQNFIFGPRYEINYSVNKYYLHQVNKLDIRCSLTIFYNNSL